jgi:hypothetical protein
MFLCYFAVLWILIQDPVTFSPLDPGSGIPDPGWIKNQDLDPNNPDHISESLETISWVKILKFFVADPEWKNSDPG